MPTDIASGWTELSASCLPCGNGRLCTIAAAFTDIDPVDELRRIAQGRAAFRTVDLLSLCVALDRFAWQL